MREAYEMELEALGVGIPEIEDRLKRESENLDRVQTEIRVLQESKE